MQGILSFHFPLFVSHHHFMTATILRVVKYC
uniref:Uncharacterized protein n=1 Tax=Rhizophora mucronata TaxID=61149 RepID=A0A2P2NVN3_RHIMU